MRPSPAERRHRMLIVVLVLLVVVQPIWSRIVNDLWDALVSPRPVQVVALPAGDVPAAAARDVLDAAAHPRAAHTAPLPDPAATATTGTAEPAASRIVTDATGPLAARQVEPQPTESQRIESQRIESQRIESQRAASERAESERATSAQPEALPTESTGVADTVTPALPEVLGASPRGGEIRVLVDLHGNPLDAGAMLDAICQQAQAFVDSELSGATIRLLGPADDQTVADLGLHRCR